MKVLHKHTVIIEFSPEELHALVESLHGPCHLSIQENPLKALHYDLYKNMGKLYREFDDKYVMDYPDLGPLDEKLTE